MTIKTRGPADGTVQWEHRPDEQSRYTTSPQQSAMTVFDRLAPQGPQRYFSRGHNVIVKGAQHMRILPQQNSQKLFPEPKTNIWIDYTLSSIYKMITSRRIHLQP